MIVECIVFWDIVILWFWYFTGNYRYNFLWIDCTNTRVLSRIFCVWFSGQKKPRPDHLKVKVSGLNINTRFIASCHKHWYAIQFIWPKVNIILLASINVVEQQRCLKLLSFNRWTSFPFFIRPLKSFQKLKSRSHNIVNWLLSF